jgi:hypothetical protein
MMKRTEEMSFEIVDVTPALAAEWLNANTDNRPLSTRRVEQFAAVMRAGGWKVNNQAIGWDENGRLADGQHRLYAVIEANMTVRMSVARGIATDAVKTIDRGSTRMVGEVLRREGTVPNANIVAGWCNAEHVLRTNNAVKSSVEVTEEYYRRNRGFIDTLATIMPNKRPWKIAPIGAALIYAARHDPAKVEEFVRLMVSGAGLEETDPVFVIREVIFTVATRPSQDNRRALALKILRAIMAFIRGEKLNRAHLYGNDSAVAFFADPPKPPGKPTRRSR